MTSLSVYAASVTLPSITAQPATGRWEFPPANWWQWSIRQHTHEAPDCVEPQRPPTKQLEKDIFMIGTCIVFSCTHLIKYIGWWPHRSYFVCQTNMECALNFMLSILCRDLKLSSGIWVAMCSIQRISEPSPKQPLFFQLFHPIPGTEFFLVLGHQKCTKFCMKNSKPWSGRDWLDTLQGLP